MKHQNRREFLTRSTQALVATGTVSSLQMSNTLFAVPSLQSEWRNRQSEMIYRRLGRTGFMVSRMVMGGNRVAPDNHEHVLEALDHGLNYLDTAPAYGQGRSEEGYARVIQARRRDQFFLTSKVSRWDLNRNRLFREILESLPKSEQKRLMAEVEERIAAEGSDRPDYFVGYFSSQRKELEDATLSNILEERFGDRIDRRPNYKEVIIDSVEGSLKRLGTDYLDCLLCPHGANTPHELQKFPEIFEAFEELKRAGKVRHLGVSAHTDPAGILRAAADEPLYSLAMVACNFVNYRHVDDALRYAHERDLGVVAMKAAQPIFVGAEEERERRRSYLERSVSKEGNAPQRAYLWALQNPHLPAVISDMSDPDMVRDNLRLVQRA